MGRWNPAPELTQGPKERFDYMTRHLIAIRGTTYYLIRPDGYYDSTPFLGHELIPAIRSRGLEGLIETQKEGEDGKELHHVRDLLTFY